MNNSSVSWDNFYNVALDCYLHSVDRDNQDGYLNIPVQWLKFSQAAFSKPPRIK